MIVKNDINKRNDRLKRVSEKLEFVTTVLQQLKVAQERKIKKETALPRLAQQFIKEEIDGVKQEVRISELYGAVGMGKEPRKAKDNSRSQKKFKTHEEKMVFAIGRAEKLIKKYQQLKEELEQQGATYEKPQLTHEPGGEPGGLGPAWH